MNGYYPAGVTSAHPHFNPEEPQPCDCGEGQVMGGEECEACGEYAPTAAEIAEDAALEAAEARYDDERYGY
jgi:hypothetical protein